MFGTRDRVAVPVRTQVRGYKTRNGLRKCPHVERGNLIKRPSLVKGTQIVLGYDEEALEGLRGM